MTNKVIKKEKKEVDALEEKNSQDLEFDQEDISKNEGKEVNLDSVDDEKELNFSAVDDELPEEIKKRLEKRAVSKNNKKLKKKKKKVAREVKVGKAYIRSTYNNTIVTLTDMEGNVISWASAGIAGFKGPKKATPYAAQIITKIASIKAKEEFGLKELSVFVKGVGTGRDSAIRSLNANGFKIISIKDTTPIPHNGCRSKKPRKV